MLNELKNAVTEKEIEHRDNQPYNIVTLSQGAVVRTAKLGDTFESLVAEADSNLYKCKEEGRNGIVMN